MDTPPGRVADERLDSRLIERTLDDEHTEPDPDTPSRRIQGEAVAPGTTVGRYVVLSKLGEGGMGEVWAAHDAELDRRVALKLLLPGYERATADMRRERLLREAQALARLRHPNVVTVFDVGAVDDQVFVAMELIEGETLGTWMKTKRPWRHVVDVFVRAGRGLAAAHDKDLIHRDFKPDNVMIGVDGRVQVMDFGLARATDDDANVVPAVERGIVWRGEEANLAATAATGVEDPADHIHAKLTLTGAAMGTPAYMAPEQHVGARTDARTDQFAFGVALYEALYGERPFAGQTLAEVALQVTMGKVRPEPKGDRVPAWLRQVILKTLRVKADERFPSMGELLEALEADPHRRRNRLLAVLGAVSVASAAIFGFEQSRETLADQCASAGLVFHDAWNPERAAAVDAAFAKLEVPFAAEAAELTKKELDAYHQSLLDNAVQACEATNVQGTQSGELLDRRMQCLRDRATSLTAYAEMMAQADIEHAEGAVAGALALPAVGDCADAKALLNQSSEHLSDDVAAFRNRLLAMEVRLDSISAQDLFDEVQTLESDSRSIDDPSSKIRAALLLAQAQQHTAKDEPAGEGFERALWLAVQSRNEDLEVAAALELLRHDALAARYERAEVWRELAASAMTRSGATAKQRVLLDIRTGDLHRYSKDDAGAIEWYEKAVAAAERLDPPDGVMLARALDGLADAQADTGKLDDAIATMERAVRAVRASAGESNPRVATYLLSLGEVLGHAGQVERAKATHSEALELVERGYGPEHEMLPNALDQMGSAMARGGEFEAALPYYERAIAAVERLHGADHEQTAVLLGNLAVTHWYMGRFDKAEPIQRRVLAIHEGHYGPEHKNTAVALDNLAATLQQLGRNEEAMELFERSLPIWERTTGEKSPSLAISLKDRSRALVELGRLAEAEAALERAMTIFAEANYAPAELADAQFSLAKVVGQRARDPERALKLAHQAKETYASAGARGPAALAEIDAWIAEREG